MILEQYYNERCEIPSDINEHMPTLKKYADECDHITEMGVRWIVSTFAFLMGKPKKLISIDIDPLETFDNNEEALKIIASEYNTDFQFILGDTTKIEIEETDLLFLDTWHVYQQVKSELELHAGKVRKYIIFHDTTTFAYDGMDNQPGIWPAIQEFLDANDEWFILERYTNNNGLTIIKRK
jgi:hypothetical protein